MSVAEIKNNLIKIVLETDNQVLLEHITDYFVAVREGGDWWDELSEGQKAFIERSASQISEGKVVPHVTVRAEINRLLGKA